MTSITGFDATDTINGAYVRHPAASLKEFFVAMALGEGKSRSRGKKEFERRRTAFENGQPYRPANFVKNAVSAILRDGPKAYLEFREATPRQERRRAEDEGRGSLTA